jgi:hypothetical protein
MHYVINHITQIIGEGSFGRVWSGMWRSSQVAVKEFVFAQVDRCISTYTHTRTYTHIYR